MRKKFCFSSSYKTIQELTEIFTELWIKKQDFQILIILVCFTDLISVQSKLVRNQFIDTVIKINSFRKIIIRDNGREIYHN